MYTEKELKTFAARPIDDGCDKGWLVSSFKVGFEQSPNGTAFVYGDLTTDNPHDGKDSWLLPSRAKARERLLAFRAAQAKGLKSPVRKTLTGC